MPEILLPERSFVEFRPEGAEALGAHRRWLARARDFSVEWVVFGPGGEPCAFSSDAETLVIVAKGPVLIETPKAASVPAATDSVAIVPAGQHLLHGADGARCAVVASQRLDLQARAIQNGQAYAEAGSGGGGRPRRFQRLRPLASPQVLGFDQIKASPEKPRLKMLQTETLSINIVDYLGPRDRSALSPHSHADFEQGSLALEGRFVHHLRTPWGSNADLWRDDEHLAAPSPSLVVVPLHVIHTTEGTGEGRHLLIDLFSPPREDFIASRWVFNAGDYQAAAAGP